MTSELLTYLIAVADYGSISKAAAQCSISQPALSQSIKDVEAGLGVVLFLRHNHGVELTDCGKIFINNARAMIYTENQMMEAIAELNRADKESHFAPHPSDLSITVPDMVSSD